MIGSHRQFMDQQKKKLYRIVLFMPTPFSVAHNQMNQNSSIEIRNLMTFSSFSSIQLIQIFHEFIDAFLARPTTT